MSEKKPLDVQAIRARCDAATPGPWFATEADSSMIGSSLNSYNDSRYTVSTKLGWAGWETDGGHEGYGISEANALFIAHAREDVPALVAENRELRAELYRLLRSTVAIQKYTAAFNAYKDLEAEMAKALQWIAKHPDVGDPFLPTVESERRCRYCNEIVEGIPDDFPRDQPVFCSRAHAEAIIKSGAPVFSERKK